MPGRPSNSLLALVRLLWFAPGALATLARFALRSRRRHRRALRQALRALDAGLPGEHGEPLEQVSPRVHEIRRDYLLARGLPELQPGSLTFIHLNGTGEPLHTVLPGLIKVFSAQPELAAHRHLLVDVPDEVGAFDGALEFRAALDRQLAPILEQSHRGLVLVGLSRGGAAAMDLGAAWTEGSAESQAHSQPHSQPHSQAQSQAHSQAQSAGMRVGVVAMSPPIIGDYERPRTVRDIASLERVVEQLAQLARFLPGWWLRAQDAWLRRSYLALTCFTLSEFQMDSDEVLRWAAWDLKHQDPIPSILRANREFGMLLRVSDEHLLEGCMRVARACAAHEELFVCMLWGAQDDWVPAERCATRARSCFEAAGAPLERALVRVLPGWSHAMSRQFEPDVAELAGCMVRVMHAVGSEGPGSALASSGSGG